MAEKSIILYYSSNYAIWTSKLLHKRGMYHKLIPVPRHLSSDCGYCVEVRTEDVPIIEGLLKEYGVEYERIEMM
ncbi:MAG: DUF3343 domain-containing protein [Spirochaetes bacterium]|nr:DUF3343 domain-containing protein [Spirochaetota bacterium]